jgi:hypothetical protein
MATPYAAMRPGIVANNPGIIRLGKKSIPIDVPQKMNIAPMVAVMYFTFWLYA